MMEDHKLDAILKALDIRSWSDVTIELIPRLVGIVGGMDTALAAAVLPKLTGEVFTFCSTALNENVRAQTQIHEDRHECDLNDQQFFVAALEQAESPEERAEVRNDSREAQHARYARDAEEEQGRAGDATKVLVVAGLVLLVIVAAAANARATTNAHQH